jgi:prophage regulatory protein
MSDKRLKPAYLDRINAAEYVSLSVPTMERMVARGAFPGPRQLTDKRVGWLVREIEEWCESRPASTNLPVENCGRNQTA